MSSRTDHAPTPAVVFDFGAVLFQWQPLALLQQTVPDLAPDEASARRVASWSVPAASRS